MHECIECEETIRNPVCPECLAEGVAAWTGEKLGPQMAHNVFVITRTLAYRFGNVRCIKCQTPMQLCAYCFVNELVTTLHARTDARIKLLEYFSFEFEKREFMPVLARG